jgi:Uma2 family endonuclease
MRNIPPKRLTLGEFREWERQQPSRHELIGGEVVAMTGARARHVRVVGRLLERLRQHLRGSPCEAVSNDLRITVPLGDAYYPDVMVLCGDDRPGDDDDEVASATVVVEVISPSTAQIDDTRKRWGYLSLPKLAHYVLIDPAEPFGEVVTREPDGSHRGRRLAAAADLLELPAIGFACRLGELYRDE